MALELNDTICALATPPGHAALGIIRLSGPDAFRIADTLFRGKHSLSDSLSHTVQYGMLSHGNQNIDEVMAAVFRKPRSFTTEDSVEFSCHGSPFILGQVLRALCAAGARPAGPGEFSLRAFLHGRIDLSQAEAVADLIAADSAAARDLALNQLRGGVSGRIAELRSQLIDFAALVELELDFSEEDVEFVKRPELQRLVGEIRQVVADLSGSFRLGNAIKSGVSTVIAGRPNAGKSTLLNAILQEDRALVSDVPGTTRDTIEEIWQLDGISFRLIDTAGIREASDTIERMGVERTMEKIRSSALLLYVFDVIQSSPEQLSADLAALQRPGLELFVLGNKSDLDVGGRARECFATLDQSSGRPIFWISAAHASGLQELSQAMLQSVIRENQPRDQVIISNLRHYEALRAADSALADVLMALEEGRSGELMALDIRRALDALGLISGQVTPDDILGSVFGRFCIGK